MSFIAADAVYSDDLTTLGDSVMRVPYFTHIHRRQNQQSQKLDEMEDQLETVKKRYSCIKAPDKRVYVYLVSP